MKVHKDKTTKTKLQWEKLGMKPKADAQGEELWANGYYKYFTHFYGPDEVEPMTEEDITAYKARISAERKDQRKRREEEKQWQREQEKEDSFWLTACQCLECGYIPTDKTPRARGECLYWKGRNYYYYDIRKCEFDIEKAAQISKTFPQWTEENPYHYDGSAWWIDYNAPKNS